MCLEVTTRGVYTKKYQGKDLSDKTVIKHGIKKGVPINRRVTFIVSLDSKTDIRVCCRKNRKEIASNI